MIWGVKQHFLGQDLIFVTSGWCCLDFNYDERELLGTANHRFYILWITTNHKTSGNRSDCELLTSN